MKNQNMTSYLYTNRLKAETRLELFDKYYLAVSEKRPMGTREFKLELAILNPEARHMKEFAYQWLAGAGIAALAALYFLNALFSSTNDDSLLPMLGGSAVAILLTVLFIALFVLSIKRKWVLETRAAHHPLIEIPYHHNDRKRAVQFVELLSSAIETNIAAKGYDNEQLFAGEMRMLRRLAKNSILSSSNYDRAKKQMLEKNGHMGFVS